MKLSSLRYRIVRENKKNVYYDHRIKGHGLHVIVMCHTITQSSLQIEYDIIMYCVIMPFENSKNFYCSIYYIGLTCLKLAEFI